MMGKQERQAPLFSYNVNLAKRIRQDHPLRRVDEAVDFSFVRAEVAGFYGWKGNESVDPEVIMKMMFLLFFDDVPSERKLMSIIPERLDYMWFLGYGLDDDIPNHSVLSKARRRWGCEVFENLFVRTVKQCVDAGLVDGSKLHFDGSLVDADASNDSVIEGPPELIAQLRAAFRGEEFKLDYRQESDDEDDDDSDGPPEKSYYQKKNESLVSSTDPDAAVVSKKGVPAKLRYKNHRSVDDAEGVITAMETTSGEVEENARLFALIEQSERNTGVSVRTAVADAQYGTVENFRECARRGIKSHMADLAETHKNTGRKTGIFDENDFVYVPEEDVYICPAGHFMKRRRHKKKRKAYEYALSAKFCNACELKSKCTKSKHGRSIKRHEDHELIEAARAESKSRAARRDRTRRKHFAEGAFADAKNNHGFKRARWRRLWRQRIQDLLIAVCQNIRILLSRTRPGPMAESQKAASRSKFGLYRDLPELFSDSSALKNALQSIGSGLVPEFLTGINDTV